MLVVLLVCLVLPMMAAADDGVVQGSTISGTVRVYLSSIGSNTSVDLTIDGSYSIGGDTSRAIARGTQLTVKNSGGTLSMTMNGQTQSMGSRFKLRRHQTSGNNGVRIMCIWKITCAAYCPTNWITPFRWNRSRRRR